MEEAIVPAIYDPSRIDIQVMVESEEAIAMAREIIVREGIFAGIPHDRRFHSHEVLRDDQATDFS